jgi:predicted phage tail protein
MRALAGTCLAAALAGGLIIMSAGIVAASALVTVLSPGQPTGLTATVGGSRVILSWTAPASTAGADPATSYNVYDGTTADFRNGTAVATSATTSATVTGLAGGTTYYFRVTGVNAGGQGPASQEASAGPASAPGPPTGLTVTPGSSRVSLSWAAPASDGGSPVTGYKIYDGTTADFRDGASAATSTTTSATVTGLAGGTTYYFRVTAVNAVSEGPASAEASATVTMPPAEPGPPTGLTAASGGGRVRLSWTAPASNGGSPVTGYIIYQGTSPGGESAALVNGSMVKATGYTVTGLANGTTYYFRVAAVNAVGQGRESGETSATPVSPVSPAPGTTSASATSASRAPGTTSASGAPGAPAGLTATAGDSPASAKPIGEERVSPTAPTASKQLITLLASVSVAASAGAFALAAYGRRQRSRQPRRKAGPPPAARC